MFSDMFLETVIQISSIEKQKSIYIRKTSMNIFRCRLITKGLDKHNIAKKRREMPYSKYKMTTDLQKKVFKMHYTDMANKQNEFFKENNLDPDLIMKTCIFYKISVNDLIAGLQRYFAMKMSEEKDKYIMDYDDVKLHQMPTVVLTPIENEISKLCMKNFSKNFTKRDEDSKKKEERSSGEKLTEFSSSKTDSSFRNNETRISDFHKSELTYNKQLNKEEKEERNLGIDLVSDKHQIQTKLFEFCALLTGELKMDIDGNSSDMFRFLPTQTNLSIADEQKRAENNNLRKTGEESGENKKVKTLVTNQQTYGNVNGDKNVVEFRPKFKKDVEDVLNTLISSWENMELGESNKCNVGYSVYEDSVRVSVEDKRLPMPAREDPPESNGSIPTTMPIIRNDVEIIKHRLPGEKETSESIYMKSGEHAILSKRDEKRISEIGKGKTHLHDEIMNEEGILVLEKERINERENKYVSESNKCFVEVMKDEPISAPDVLTGKQENDRILETDISFSGSKEIEGCISAFKESTTERDNKHASESNKCFDEVTNGQTSVPRVWIEGHDNEYISETDRSITESDEMERQLLTSDVKEDMSLNDIMAIVFDTLKVDHPLEESRKDSLSAKDNDTFTDIIGHQLRAESSNIDEISSSNMYYDTPEDVNSSPIAIMKR